MQKPSTTIHDYSTRRKRRGALASIITALEHITDAEGTYKDNMPANLQGSEAYENTDYYIGLLEEALDSLHLVYDD